MVLILRLLSVALKEFDEKNRDRRSENYIIGGSLYQIFSIVLLYYVFIKHVGPWFMENRNPFQLKNTILIYNVMQVIFNGYIVMRATYAMIWTFPEKQTFCALSTKDDSALGKIELHLCYCFVLLKIFDFMDTVFMSLRKRTKQISFLHFYHHLVMTLASAIHFRYIPGGHIITMGVLNSFVHVVMYFYYFISALKPELKNSIWWKKHITQIQILQFLFLTVYYGLGLMKKNCEYPAMASLFVVLQAIILLVLFSDFYRKNYLQKHSLKQNIS